jgi:hypothetical protein
MIRAYTRSLALIGVSAVVVWLCSHHEHGGVKGRCVPIPNIVSCIVVAAAAALLCKRFWLAFAVPFVSGVAGVFGAAGPFYGPYGGVLGFLVGLWILLLPFGRRPSSTGGQPGN